MKGPSLSTAIAFLLLVLSTTTETAVLSSSVAVPNTTKDPGTVYPNTTKASGTVVPSSAKASRTVPGTTTTSGTVPSVTKASGTLSRSTTNKPSTVTSATTNIASAGSIQESRSAEDHGGIGGPDSRLGETPSTVVGNATLCPESCKCTLQSDSLKIWSCLKDPSYPAKSLTTIFDKYPNTTSLEIRSSHLTSLPRSVCRLKNLRNLRLPDNQLSDIPWDCLEDLRDLREIRLSQNRFTGLTYPIRDFQSLEKLLVDNNQLNYIDQDAFRGIQHMSNLKAVNLQSNQLQSVDSWPLMGRQAAILLDRNQISNFTNKDRLRIRCNAEANYAISLNRNNITRLTDMFNGWGITTKEQQSCVLQKSTTIKLDQNAFICDCVDYDIYKIMQNTEIDCFGGRIFCNKPDILRRMRLMDLPLDKISCSIVKDCPNNCQCHQITASHSMRINCSGVNTTDTPNNLPSLPDGYLYDLDYSRNKYETIDVKSYFHLVRSVVFTHNVISYITKKALLALENVTTLTMDHNRLFYLPEKILGVVNMSASLRMTLGENPWICDCYAKEGRKWILKMGNRIVDKGSIICHEPRYVKGRNLPSMRDDELRCGYTPPPDYAFYFGIGVATVAVWMVVIGIPTGILYRHRLTLFRKYGWHMFNNDECFGEFKEFDIFLAYAEVNVDYAMGKLFVELENKGYIVAYHRINFIGGKPIKVNIEECIRKSKRTVTVISKRFFNSEWCRCELMTALDIDKKQNTKRQIGILLEEVDDVPELDPKVKKFIKTDHCLRLGEDLFEDKLEYMLNRTKLKDQKVRRPKREQLGPRVRVRRAAPPPPKDPEDDEQQEPEDDAAGPAPAANAAHNRPLATFPADAAVLNIDTARLLDNQQ